MKIYDISQPVFGCVVYDGDRAPEKIEEMRMSEGDLYNLTSFSMCAHNGTHIDAPFHFIAKGDTVDMLPLEKTVGYCYITEQKGDIDGEKAKEILALAGEKRILIKGEGVITASAAEFFADAGIYLLGVEGQTVGPEKSPMEVHKILLGADTVLLEGIRLDGITEGKYFLCAQPINLNGCDGAPCRAILIDNE